MQSESYTVEPTASNSSVEGSCFGDSLKPSNTNAIRGRAAWGAANGAGRAMCKASLIRVPSGRLAACGTCAVRELFAFAAACLSVPDYTVGTPDSGPTDGFAIDRDCAHWLTREWAERRVPSRSEHCMNWLLGATAASPTPMQDALQAHGVPDMHNRTLIALLTGTA